MSASERWEGERRECKRQVTADTTEEKAEAADAELKTRTSHRDVGK